MKLPKRWYWLTERRKFTDMPADQVIDLLRYDGARVETNAPTGYYMFSAEGTRGPVVERLRTYHAEPAWISPRALEPDLGSSHAWAWFHENGGK